MPIQPYNSTKKTPSEIMWELLKEVKELKIENERLKKQYNCYACGSCKGKEDYTNLEKHHKGLRKQFEKYYQQSLDDEIQINSLWRTLQEIKEILLQAMDVKSNAYKHFSKVEQAIDLITKAKEE